MRPAAHSARRRPRHRCLPGLALALAVASAPVLASGPPEAEPAASGEPLVVAFRVNSQAKGDLFAWRTAQGEILVRRSDLPALGFRALPDLPLVMIGAQAYVSLRALGGVQAEFDPASLSMSLLAGPELLERTVVDADIGRPRYESLGSDSAFLNWGLEHERTASGDRNRLAGEAGLRIGSVLLQSSSHTATLDSGEQRLVRLSTTAFHDRPQDLQRWMAGDFFTSAPELGSSVNLGGLSVSRLFSLDPYARQHPLGSLTGQVVYPSEVDVFVDGQRVRTDRIQPGTFEIRDLYLEQGARAVQLVLRDPFGRVQQIDYPFYASDLLLRRGMHEYQYAVGALRRGYGLRSNDYGAAAAAAFHRYGVSDRLTLGLRAEARSGLLSLGTQGTTRIGGSAGVLSWSLAASRAEPVSGHAAALRYGFQARAWSLGAALRRDSSGFATLGEGITLGNRKQSLLLQASRHVAGAGTVSVLHARQTVHAAQALPALPAGAIRASQQARHSTTLGFATYLPALRASLRLGVGQVSDARGRHTEMTAGITLFLDGLHILSGTARQADGGFGEAGVRLTRPTPAGQGWGWDLGVQGTGAAGTRSTPWQAAAQFNARHAQFRGEWTSRDGSGDVRLAASGAIAWVGNGLYLSRPVQDSFAVARVSKLAGVPVSLNGMAMGETDSDGEVFIPDISAWSESEIAIDAGQLPIEYTVDRVRRRVLLPTRTGAVIEFNAVRMQALTARLVLPGEARPLAGAVVRLAGPGRTPVETVTGRDGELYLENLPAGLHEATAEAGPTACDFRIEVPVTDQLLIELGDLLCVSRPPQRPPL